MDLKYLILLYFLFSSTFFYCQEKYIVENFTADSGELPQNSVKSIVKDKYGFLWLTTENGLVRYDGKFFEVFNIDMDTIENRMSLIEGDAQDDYLCTFVNSKDVKIVIKNRQFMPVFKYSNSILFDEYKSYFTENIVKTVQFYNDINKNFLYHYFITKDIYYTLENQRVTYYNHSKVVNYPQQPFDINQLKLFLLDGSLFLIKDNELVCFDKNGGVKTVNKNFTLGIEKHKFIINNASKQTFLLMNDKIFLLTKRKDVVSAELVYEGNSFNLFEMTSMYYDTRGILYAGSLINGLYIVRKNYFKVNYSYENEFFYGISSLDNETVINSKGHIYSENGLISKSDFKKLDFSNYRNLSSVATFENKFWTHNDKAIYLIDLQKNKTVIDSVVFENVVHTIFKYEDKLWFSLLDNKLEPCTYGYINLSDKTLKKFSSNYLINSILQTDNNTVYLGAANGLYVFKLNNTSITKLSKSLQIRNLIPSNDGNIWITTYGKGLFLFKDNVMKKVPFKNQEYLNYPHCVVEDKKGFLWIPTNNGLYQLKKQSVYDLTDGKKDQIYYHYYSKRDGLLTNEFNGGCYPCGINLNDKSIVLPSMKGVVFVDIKNLKPVFANKEIYVDKIEVDGDIRYVKDTINLNTKFSFLKIFVDNPNYGSKNNLSIEYRIKNFENSKWQKLSDENVISFTTLPIGYLELEIRKIIDFNESVYNKSIIVYVKPNFWQTNFFKALLFAMVFLLGYIFFRVRVYLIKRENKLLNIKISESTQNLKEIIQDLRLTQNDLDIQVKNQKRMIGSITHDIKSPLKYLIFTSKIIYDGNNKEEISESLKSIYNSSFKLYHFVENLLEYSKVYMKREEGVLETFSIFNLFEEKIQLFNSIAKLNKTKIINKSNKDQFFRSKKVFIAIIVHNLIDNSVKHTINGKITLEFEERSFYQIIRISDNGNGMTEEIRDFYQNLDIGNEEAKFNSNGMGIRIIKELVIFLNAKLIIESKLNKGTTVSIIFKYNS